MSKEVEAPFLGTEVLSVGGGMPFSGDMITKEPQEIEVEKPQEKTSAVAVVASKKSEVTDTEGSSAVAGKDAKDDSKGLGSESDIKSGTDTQAQEVSKKESKSDKKDTKSSSLSAAAVIGESFKKEGLLPDDVKITDNISGKELKQLIYENIYKDVESSIRTEYEESYGEDLMTTASLLQQGVDPEDIKEISAYKRIAAASLSEDDDRNFQIKEAVIKAMYQDKGIKDSKIAKLVDDAMEEDEGDSEFKEAKSYFAKKVSTMENDIKKSVEAAEKARLADQEAKNKDIKAAIKSGDIYGTSSDADKKKLEKFLFSQDETIKKDGKTYKVTGFQKALDNYNSDIKKQLTFAKLLMDGFDLSSIEDIGKNKAVDELDEALEGHVSRNAGGGNKSDEKIHSNFFGGLHELS